MINLEKGQSISLKKTNKDKELEKIFVALGWDVCDFTDADLDAFILQLDKNNKVIDTIYYGNLTSDDGAIKHTGDNLTGEGDGDDEIINIKLKELDPRTNKLVVAVNIYQCRLTFEQVENAYVRVVNQDNKEQLIRYDLTKVCGNNYCINVAEIYKDEEGNWNFKANGEPSKHRSISNFRSSYVDKTNSTSKNDIQDINSTSQPKEHKGFFAKLFGK